MIWFLTFVAFTASARAQPASPALPAPDVPPPESPPAAPADPAATAAPAGSAPPSEARLLEAKPAEAKPPAKAPAVTSKWDTTLYGFVEGDTIYDSTQGLNDNAGNSAVPRKGSYAGNHGQTTMGARNSRIGYRISAPAVDDIKASAQLEMDFVGNQPPGISESAFFASATFRVRHLNVKLETPIVDVLIGQSWQLFGWQTLYQPATVQIQGIPGEVFSRSPQIRLSKKLACDPVSLELAVAAARPPQRASATPDGQAGIKLNLDSVKAFHTAGSTGTALDSASIGVSVVGRRFAVDEFTAAPHSQVVRNGYGLSIDALIPVVPATKEHHDNALTLLGSFVTGAGTADLYSGLSGGVSQPALPNPGMTTPAPTYTPNIDNGLALFSADGTLHPMQWTSYLVGAQYYLPPSGKVFLAANYSHTSSGNAHAFGAATKVFDQQDWADGNLFVDLTPAVRLGLELAWINQTYVNGTEGTNYRAQFSGWLIF
ncbi:MAG TPA: hypothetical protein VHN14_07750 [Kofleriaceae bacterium]|nr:hypothetical protein [Kofleriaceae bacterium]